MIGLTATDARGGLALDGLPAGDYDVLLGAEGFLPGRIEALEVRPPYRAVAEATLQPGLGLLPAVSVQASGEAADDGTGGHVRLAIVGPANGPLARVEVELVPIGHRANPRVERSSEAGEVSLELPAGAWRLSIRRAGWTSLVVPRLEWGGGELLVLARMVPLPPDARVPVGDLLPGR